MLERHQDTCESVQENIPASSESQSDVSGKNLLSKSSKTNPDYDVEQEDLQSPDLLGDLPIRQSSTFRDTPAAPIIPATVHRSVNTNKWSWRRLFRGHGYRVGSVIDDTDINIATNTDTNQDSSTAWSGKSLLGGISLHWRRTAHTVGTSSSTTLFEDRSAHSFAATSEAGQTVGRNDDAAVKTNSVAEPSVRSQSSADSSTIKKKLNELEFKPTFTAEEYRASKYDIGAYVVTTVIGGIYYGWNEGLHAGFGSYATSQCLVGLAYVIMGMSLAEIVSTVSFSGGSYGMARVVLGFYVGFLVAMFEYMEYIVYTAQSAQFIGTVLCEAFHLSSTLAPVFSLLFYIVSFGFLSMNNAWFWRINAALAATSLAIILIYCFGSLPHVNFWENASFHADTQHPSAGSNWFEGGMSSFMHILPFATWGFGGLESAALMSDLTENPRVNVSQGMAGGTVILFVVTVFMIFVVASLPPGIDQLMNDCCLMNNGWSLMHVSTSDARWLLLPAQIAMGFGFLLPASKLLRAMGTSKLLPPSFGVNETSSAKVSLVYVMVMSFSICLMGTYVSWLTLDNIPIFMAQFTYLSNLWAFYKIRTDFSTRESKFRNPFGVVGAVYAALMFTLVAISVLAFQKYHTIIVVFCLTVLLSVYYFVFAKKNQHFSEDEQKSLLVLHVIRNNKKKKRSAATSKASKR
jgi:ethanolamine permease